MKRIFAYILCLLFLFSINSYAGWTDWVKPGGGSSASIQTDSNCNQSKYFAIGTLCQDTDDGKLYKGTGAAVVEIAAGTGAEIDDTKGNGDTTYTWSADKIYDQLALKLNAARFVFAGANNITTFTGDYSLGVTLTGNTAVTFPTSGTLATTALKPSDLSIASQAAGDIIYFNGTNWLRLAKDTGKYLKSGDSAVSWDSPSASSLAASDVVAYTADASPSADDLAITVNDPGGTAALRKVTLANLQSFILTAASGVSLNASSADSSKPFKAGTTAAKPGTCAAGDTYWESNGKCLSICSDTNTWTQIMCVGADGSYRMALPNNTAISPTASTNEFYPEANIWKVNQNGTESSVCIGPTAGQVSFTGPTQARAYALPDAAATILYSGGELGTPSGGTLTNCSGLPVSGITASTSTALGVGSVELGHASDTTLSRSSAGKLAVEGVEILYATAPATIDGSAAATLTAAQMSDPRCSVTNYGQTTADVAITLPTAAANLSCLFNVGTAQSNKWGVRAGTNDKIYLIAADGTISAGSDNGYARMTAAQVGQSFACWSFTTGSSAWDWQCKAIAIGTSTFAAN